MKTTIILLATAAAVMPAAIQAQVAVHADDVVVMRRVVAPATRQASTPTPTPPTTPTPSTGSPTPAAGTPTPGSGDAGTTPGAGSTPTPTQGGATPTPTPSRGAWTYGDWTFQDADACVVSATQTRTVACVASGQTVDASRCDGDPDVSFRYITRTDGCASVAWVATPSRPYDATCTTAATVTQSAACVARTTDGRSVAMPADKCMGERPAATVTVPETTTGCASVAWTAGVRGPWTPSECSAAATYTVATDCRAHAAAGDAGFVVDASRCDAALKPTAPAPAIVTSNCTSIDWVTTITGAWSSTCSATATRTQTAACTATNGTTSFTVPDASCNAATRPGATTAPTAVYSGCAAKWSTTAWTNASGHGECLASVPQTRTAICTATVGGKTTTIPDSNCEALGVGAGTKETVLTRTTSDYSTCDGTWVAGTTYGYGTCSAGVRSKNRNDICQNTATGTVYADGTGHCNATHPAGATTSVGCLGSCGSFDANKALQSTTSDISSGQAIAYLASLTGTAKTDAARTACEEVKANGQYKYLIGCLTQGQYTYAMLGNSKAVTLANSAVAKTSAGDSLAVCTAY